MSAKPVLSRRQALISAGLAGGALMCGAKAAFSGEQHDQRSGIAFGTLVTIKARHDDKRTLDTALDAAWAEVMAIEAAASLYSPHSAISHLNRTGKLTDAPAVLRDLLAEALAISELTDGAFDPTVQPLWTIYADAKAQGRLPDRAELEAARSRIGWRGISLCDREVSLAAPGMAITLNGIAQGYATDRCLAALRAHGIENAFLDTGELGALGRRDASNGWAAGVADPRKEGAYAAIVKPFEGVLATSGDYATRFSDDYAAHHVFDPATLASPQLTASVSVLARSGARADGLATALMVLEPKAALALAARAGVEVLIIAKSGERSMTPGFPVTA